MSDILDRDQSLLEEEEGLALEPEEVEGKESERDDREEGVSFGSRLRQNAQALRIAYEEIEKKGSADVVEFFKTYAVFIGISLALILSTIALSYYTESKYIEVERNNRTLQELNISSQTYRAATVEAEQIISVRRQVQTLGISLVTNPLAPYQIEDKSRDAVDSTD